MKVACGDEVARAAFAHWVSGFTDGEGTFVLTIHKRNKAPFYQGSAHFAIKLRSDDSDVLREIKAFFGCGVVREETVCGNSKPQTKYIVYNIAHLANIIVPHFERYPLRAKKRHDFGIWRRGVLLLHEVQQRPQKATAPGRSSPRKWTEESKQFFSELLADLRAQRVYRPAIPAITPALTNPLRQQLECQP